MVCTLFALACSLCGHFYAPVAVCLGSLVPWLCDQAVRARAAADDAACAEQRPRQDLGDDPGSDDSGVDGSDADDPEDRFLDRLARPAGSYGVDAATYLAIVTGEMAGLGLD